jgi:hypothetical protein
VKGALMSLCMLLHIVILCFALLRQNAGIELKNPSDICIAFNFQSQNHANNHLIPSKSLQVNELVL